MKDDLEVIAQYDLIVVSRVSRWTFSPLVRHSRRPPSDGRIATVVAFAYLNFLLGWVQLIRMRLAVASWMGSLETKIQVGQQCLAGGMQDLLERAPMGGNECDCKKAGMENATAVYKSAIYTIKV